MTLARNLLSTLKEGYVPQESINESKNEFSDVTLSEFFSLILPTDYLSVSLDESENGSVYVDTEVCGLPITFSFYMENEEPKMSVMYNETEKVVKLSKKVLNENGDFEVDSAIEYLPVEKIISIVEKAIEVSEVWKTKIRKVGNKFVKNKINKPTAQIAKEKIENKKNRIKYASKNKVYALNRKKKLKHGYTNDELKLLNARRTADGKPEIDNHGKVKP